MKRKGRSVSVSPLVKRTFQTSSGRNLPENQAAKRCLFEETCMGFSFNYTFYNTGTQAKKSLKHFKPSVRDKAIFQKQVTGEYNSSLVDITFYFLSLNI